MSKLYSYLFQARRLHSTQPPWSNLDDFFAVVEAEDQDQAWDLFLDLPGKPRYEWELLGRINHRPTIRIFRSEYNPKERSNCVTLRDWKLKKDKTFGDSPSIAVLKYHLTAEDMAVGASPLFFDKTYAETIEILGDK